MLQAVEHALPQNPQRPAFEAGAERIAQQAGRRSHEGAGGENSQHAQQAIGVARGECAVDQESGAQGDEAAESRLQQQGGRNAGDRQPRAPRNGINRPQPPRFVFDGHPDEYLTRSQTKMTPDVPPRGKS